MINKHKYNTMGSLDISTIKEGQLCHFTPHLLLIFSAISLFSSQPDPATTTDLPNRCITTAPFIVTITTCHHQRSPPSSYHRRTLHLQTPSSSPPWYRSDLFSLTSLETRLDHSHHVGDDLPLCNTVFLHLYRSVSDDVGQEADVWWR